jgi:hypothetical protein
MKGQIPIARMRVGAVGRTPGRLICRAACGAALVAALGGPAPARADDPSAPAVNAQLLSALPPGAAIAVEPRDDSDDNLQLRDLMIAHLTERHAAVAADAPLLLRFSTTVLSDRDAAAAAGRGGGGRGGGRSLTSALINGSRDTSGGSPPARPSGGVKHRISATLERRDGGQVLWKGDVTITGDQNERALPAQLAAALVDNIGRTLDTRQPADATPAANAH